MTATRRLGGDLQAISGAGPCWLYTLVAILGIVLASLSAAPGARAQTTVASGSVFIVPIHGTIDLGLAPYLSRVLDEAEASEAAAVVLEIDTPGGRLDAVLQMRDALLDSPVRTIAFVDRTAFSAGALIAISSEEIYMPSGAVMGAATPVDGATGEAADAKVISAVRKTFKTTAEARGRDPQVAEAMVDPDVVIEGLSPRGELLTLTTAEALAWGYADGEVTDRTALLAATGLSAAPLVERAPSPAEEAVRFITDPVVASLLIILALILIVADFFVEGFGVAGAAGIVLLGLFFWGHFLSGLAGWEDIALVGLGLVLIAAEILILPGFGVAGVLGVVALGSGLFLAMLGREIQTPEGIVQAGVTVLVSLLAVVAGIVLVMILLPRTNRLNSLMLQPPDPAHPKPGPAAGGRWMRWFGDATTRPAYPDARIAGSAGAGPATTASMPALLGATGVALTDLHPSGVAQIDGHRVDVVSSGGYIRAGDRVVVIADERYRRVVRREG